MDLEIINKLYLELSQVTTAKTKREINLEDQVMDLQQDALEHNKRMAKIPSISRPKTASEGLRFLADWFDAVYQDAGKNDEVQQELRRWATDFESK